MKSAKPRTVVHRRVRQGKTSYSRRLRSLLSGKLCLVVRLTNQRVIAQLIRFRMEGDVVQCGVDSFSLKKLGWSHSCKNTPAAYLTGFLLGRKAVATGLREAIFNTGLRRPLAGGRLYAFLKGALDAGMEIPHGEGLFPSDERIQGKHVEGYVGRASLPPGQFTQYLKSGIRGITDEFARVKQNIERQ